MMATGPTPAKNGAVVTDHESRSSSMEDDDDLDNSNNNDDDDDAGSTATAKAVMKGGVPPIFPAAAALSARPGLPLPVDRDWLQKLLRRHHYDTPQFWGGTTAATATTTTNTTIPPPMRMRAYVLAPMVDQSDLAFRIQCRKYGTNLCYTPMIHAKLFATDARYRRKFGLGDHNNNTSMDRPLIAQLCGSDCHYMLLTAQALAPYCDAIDINCGCPQGIAKRGNYGAFLLEQEEPLLKLVQYLVQHLTIPLTIKVRLLLPPPQDTTTSTTTTTEEPASEPCQQQPQPPPRERSIQRSLQLYTKLVDAGIHLLTVHGRTRNHKGVGTGAADWDAIRQVVQTLGHRIPILANGSMACPDDIRACLEYTGCDGVMSSEAILEYPPLFQGMMEQDYYDYYYVQQQQQAMEVAVTGSSGTESDMDASVTTGSSIQDVGSSGLGSNAVSVVPPPDTTTATTTPKNNTLVRTVGRLDLALEYLDLAEQYPPQLNGQGSGIKCIRVHVHRFLHADLQEHADLRQHLVMARSVAELRHACGLLRERHAAQQHDVRTEQLSWYMRHRNLIRDAYGMTVQVPECHEQGDVCEEEEGVEEEKRLTSAEKEAQECEESACFTSLFGEVDW